MNDISTQAIKRVKGFGGKLYYLCGDSTYPANSETYHNYSLYAIDLKTGAKTLVGSAVADDAKFASGDTATFTLETSAPAQFYKAVIVAE